jgi:putative transposase
MLIRSASKWATIASALYNNRPTASVGSYATPPRLRRTAMSAGELLRRALRADARTELTDRILILGERHLRTVLARYSAHYNGRRPHRALSLLAPSPDHPVASLPDSGYRT